MLRMGRSALHWSDGDTASPWQGARDWDDSWSGGANADAFGPPVFVPPHAVIGQPLQLAAMALDHGLSPSDLQPYPASINLADLDGTNGFKLSGERGSVGAGYSVSDAGDVNHDGFADLIIGSRGPDPANPNGPGAGEAYVVFGHAGGFAANTNLGTLDGTDGFRLFGVAAKNNAGWSVSSAGDINGDGFADVIVGARFADLYNGAAYVVFGKAGGFASDFQLSAIDGSNGFKMAAVGAHDYAGWTVGTAGDVNGDGFADLFVSSPHADPNGGNSGAVYVVFGHPGGYAANLDLGALDGGNGFRLSGPSVYSGTGYAVSSAGDVNGDGFSDVIVGAEQVSANGTYSGAAYMVFGKAGGFAANIDLAALSGSDGFALAGAAVREYAGRSVASAGDINGDGYADVIVGAPGGISDGHNRAGVSYVVFGHAGGFSASLDLGALNGSNGFKIAGAAAYNNAGYSVAAAGDVNGDGFADVLIGAQNAGPAGTSYVVFGHAGGFAASLDLSSLNGTQGFAIVGVAGADYSGHAISSGDVNGDGFSDLIVGAFGANTSASMQDTGATYVVFGRLPGIAVNLTGTIASQTLAGGDFADTLSGLGGDDHLFGNGGNDSLDGGDGADTLTGGAGDDALNGGSGFADTAVYTGSHADYALAYAPGMQDVTVTDLRPASPEGTDTLSNIEQMRFSDGLFTLHTGLPQVTLSLTLDDKAGTAPWQTQTSNFDAQGSLISQTVLNDNGTLWQNNYGTPGSGTLWMTSYSDASGIRTQSATYTDGTHKVAIFDNTNAYGWNSAIIAYDAAWNVTAVHLVPDGPGPTVVSTMQAIAAIYDTALWYAEPYDPNQGAPVAIALTGGVGTDALFGHAGGDTLNGMGGNDYIRGGTGNDTLSGGAGDDHFVFRAGDGLDTIADFAPGDGGGDLIDLHGYGVLSFAALQPLLSQVGADTLIAFDAQNHITLHNVLPAQLNSGDFIFS